MKFILKSLGNSLGPNAILDTPGTNKQKSRNHFNFITSPALVILVGKLLYGKEEAEVLTCPRPLITSCCHTLVVLILSDKTILDGWENYCGTSGYFSCKRQRDPLRSFMIFTICPLIVTWNCVITHLQVLNECEVSSQCSSSNSNFPSTSDVTIALSTSHIKS